MRYVYRQVLGPVAFCPQCNQRLFGNNSLAHPYSCACGVWVFNFESQEYDIEPDDNHRLCRSI